jgi:hypothetical protein
MPRLVLFDDDGRELFAAPVSQENVRAVAGFIRRNMQALQAAAAFKRALDAGADMLAGLAAPPARPIARRRSRR